MDVCNFTIGSDSDRKLEEPGTGGNNGVSFHNFLIKKSYIDMDYLYGKLSKAQGLSEDTGKR